MESKSVHAHKWNVWDQTYSMLTTCVQISLTMVKNLIDYTWSMLYPRHSILNWVQMNTHIMLINWTCLLSVVQITESNAFLQISQTGVKPMKQHFKVICFRILSAITFASINFSIKVPFTWGLLFLQLLLLAISGFHFYRSVLKRQLKRSLSQPSEVQELMRNSCRAKIFMCQQEKTGSDQLTKKRPIDLLPRL